MKKLSTVAGVALLGLSAQTAFAYSLTTTATFSWGNTSSVTQPPGPGGAGGTLGGGPAQSTGVIRGWTSSGTGPAGVGGTNALSVMADSTFFTSLTGAANQWNSQTFLNSDFMKADGSQCIGPGIVLDQGPYQCVKSTGFAVYLGPVADAGPLASATGAITINDADGIGGALGTLKGTLTVNATSDEVDIRSASGYNVRSADGSPFGNAWYGVSTSATITLNLTGQFGVGASTVTGGTTNLRDSAFQSICSPTNATLCTASVQAGGFGNDGSAQNPGGWDLDGGDPGTAIGLVHVIGEGGALGTDLFLSGVLANLNIDALGNISTSIGEARTGLGSTSCDFGTVKWNGTKISCGTLTVQGVSLTTAVPAPAAVWLLGTGIAGLAARRFRRRIG